MGGGAVSLFAPPPKMAALPFLLLMYQLGSVCGAKDPFLYHPDTEIFVQVQNTKNKTENVSLTEFSLTSKQNREAYNAIMGLIKPNTTVAEENILLRGLEEVRKRLESAPTTVKPNMTGEAVESTTTWETAVKGVI